MNKRIVAGTIAIAACLSLTGCSPVVRGLVGVTVDTEGVVIAVLEPCENLVEGAAVYLVDDDGNFEHRLARWRFDTSEDTRELDLAGMGFLPADVERYELVAWAEHESWLPMERLENLGSVWFEVGDLENLRPGEVLYGDPWAYNSSVIGSTADFTAAACPDR